MTARVFGGDPFLSLLRVDVERIFQHIHKDGCCPAHGDGSSRGDERERGDDHLVPGTDVCGKQCGMECRGAVIDGYGMGCAAVPGKTPLELCNLLTGCQHT